MRMRDNERFELVLDWCKSNRGKALTSPRRKFSIKKTPQDFSILEVDDSKRQLRIQFLESGTILPLEYWRIKSAIEFLAGKSDYVWIGASISEPEGISLENHLKTISKKMYGRKADTKTAPHIGDLLVAAGLADYDWTKSREGRKIQGIRLRR